jgi:ribose 5-phosphate isomerase B
MLIYIGADHRGFQLKEILKKFLKDQGYEVIDVGNDHYDENDDYPDFAKLAARAVSQDPPNRRGILICGSGVGVDIVANKFKGVRSALVNSPDQAYLSRYNNDANTLSLGADFLNEEQARKILSVWLATLFSGKENPKRRLEKIVNIEAEQD